MHLRNVVKSALAHLPCKREAFSAIRLFGVPRFYKALRFDGTFQLRLTGETCIRVRNLNDYSIETEWFWRGISGWEAASIQIWMNLCRAKDIGATPVPTIWDIGACEGIYALAASALAPHSRVIAMEPFPPAFKRLKANISLNQTRIEAIEAACSDFDGSAQLYSDGCSNSNEASLLESKGVPQNSTCSVKTRSVASLVEELDISSVDLVKIDVEGAEPSVIKGMGKWLASSRPVMLVEVLSDEVATDLAEIMSPLNYLYWDINDHPRKGPFGLRSSASIRKGINLNWLFVPAEKEPLLRSCWSQWLLE